jgi:hypothetical protein
MPLGKDPQKNIAELSSRCKHEGGFGNIRGLSKGQCMRAAQAAGYSAARKKGKRVARRS